MTNLDHLRPFRSGYSSIKAELVRKWGENAGLRRPFLSIMRGPGRAHLQGMEGVESGKLGQIPTGCIFNSTWIRTKVLLCAMTIYTIISKRNECYLKMSQ